MLSKTSADQAFHDTLASLLASQHVGFVLSERLVNMPVQVMGPMYKMLSEEIDAAVRCADVRVDGVDAMTLRRVKAINSHITCSCRGYTV